MRDLQSLIIRSENCAAFIRHFLHDLNLMVLKILVGAKNLHNLVFLYVSLTKKGKALVGILHTEIIETEDLVNNENKNKQDMKELEKYLAVIKSILAKLERYREFLPVLL